MRVRSTARNTALILLVEDQEDDILLARRALKQAGITNPLQIVRSGEEAVAYLLGEGKYANRAEYPLPTLILLDLRMPGMDGYEVLSWIRQQDGLRGMPVIVLTSSNLLSDVNRAYQLGANSFFVKDVDFENSAELFRLLQQYWLDRALTPETQRQPPRKRANH
jgi:CheY-like chemotaxis protein